MKHKLLLITCILISIASFSQSKLCGTKETPITRSFKNLLDQSKTMQSELCVNVQFHILKNSSGNAAFNGANTIQIIEDLNFAYNTHGIFFNSVGVNDITNDDYYNIDEIDDDDTDTEYEGLRALDENNPNALNIYIVNNFDKYAGKASRPGNYTVIQASSVLGTTTVHEIGHNLGLLHTHSTSSGIENIERSGNNKNCDSAGDGFCSTPADPELQRPNLSYKVNTSCVYTGGETRNSLPYNPDTHNYMSYSRRYCRDRFTDEQGNFMKAMLQTETVLQPVISSSCAIPEITGPGLVCNSSNSVFTLQNPPTSVNWNTGPNLTIISQTNSSITVRASNSFVRGASFVEINGSTARKDFYVGKPDANLPQAPNLCTNSFSDPYTLPASEGAISYRLKSGSPNLKINGQSEVTFTMAPIPFINFSSSSPGVYLVELFTTNACGESRGAMYIVSETCGLGGPGGFNVYPNPASSEVTIEANPEKSNSTYEMQSFVPTQSTQLAKLYGFNGAFVKDIELDPYGTTKLDVSNLKEGMYFLKIQVREEEETYKIIVRR